MIINDHDFIQYDQVIFFGEYEDSEFKVVAELAKGMVGIEINIEDDLGMPKDQLIEAISDYMIGNL